MDRLPVSMEIVDSLVNMSIKDHKKALKNISEIKIIENEKMKIPVELHSNLVIKLKKDFLGEKLLKVEAATNRLISYLNDSAEVFSYRKSNSLITFNLVYSRLTEDKKVNITSAVSVDISPENIIISPNMKTNQNDLLNLYYGIDRYFDFYINDMKG